jgi:cobalt-zinc-cadmium efflux system membrane fusion protein
MTIRTLHTALTLACVVLLATPTAAPAGDDCGHDHGATPSTDERAFCGEHRLFEDECGICQPQRAALLAPGENLKVRLASERSALLGGLATANPGTQAGGDGIAAYAEIGYDRNRLAHVTPLVGGVIQNVLVDVGARVTAGQVLVEIVSSEVASAKHDYLAAVLERDLHAQDVQRERRLREQKIAAERDLQAAEAAFARAEVAVASAAQNLRNLGLDQDALRDIERSGDTTARYELRAPFAGEIIQRHAVLGEAVAAGAPLMQLADLSQVWLELSVPERALSVLRRGQSVTAHFDALSGVTVTGQLAWIGSGLDPRTRLLQARAVVPNPDGLLKAGLFGEAVIAVGAGASVMAVPVAAVQTVDGASFVFVQEAADLFQLRRVDLGLRLGEQVAVDAGLVATDDVVVAGSAALYTEFLKSRLGAGCAHD